MDRVISFPHLGNYYIVFDYFIRKATKCKVIVPPATTKRTIEIGSKYAPSFVCVPFKYNLGNYIEALEKGANTLVQGGGGCRYGYYGELEEKILRDLGYDFDFYNMISDNHISLKKGYKFCKKMNKRANLISAFYYLINSLVMIICMDKIEKYIRLNMGFEVVDGSFERVEKEYLNSFKDNGIFKNIYNYFKYRKNTRPGKKDGKGAFLQVERNSGGHKFTGTSSEHSKAFMATMPNGTTGLFRRTGVKLDGKKTRTGKASSGYIRRASTKKGRENIEQLHSPGVVQMLDNKVVRRSILTRGVEIFNDELTLQIEKELKKH